MSICPNKELKEYKLLETVLGHGRALAAWVLAGEDRIPTPIQAIELLYPNVHADEAFTTMDFGDIAGRYEPTYEKMIDDKILNHPSQPINDAESFNGFQKRTLERFSELLKTAPDNSVIVTHSSVLKMFNLWDSEGRPEDLRVNNKEYTEAQTHTGDVEKFKSDNGTLYVVRHGQTEDNLKGNLRSPETKLTDKGIKQAQDAAKELSKIDISELYTSPLDRAIHTSDIIMNAQEFPYRGTNKISSNLSDNGKIINVNFPISSGQRDVYSRRAGDVIRAVLGDSRVLFVQGEHLVPITRYSIQPNEESNERFFRAHEQLLQLPADTSNVEEVMGKTFPELFNSPDRGKLEYIHSMAYYIASRLLQSSDNFSGRILSSLSKDKLVDNQYVRLESSEDEKRSVMYIDGDGVYINIAKLEQELDKFDDPENFIKSIELVMTEEVIHLVATSLATNDEMKRVYNELTDKEKDEFYKTYETRDPILGGHEYIRTIIQEDIFGTSTARETNPWGLRGIRRALQYILDILSGARDRFSNMIIQRIKDYIDRTEVKIPKEDKSDNNNKRINYELQPKINRAILGGQQEGTIENASSLIRANIKAGSQIEGDGSRMDSLRKESQDSDSAYKAKELLKSNSITPKSNINLTSEEHKFNNDKQLKYELQQRISRAESEGGNGSNIENALNVTRRFSQTAGRSGQGGESLQREVWWKEIQRRNLEIGRLDETLKGYVKGQGGNEHDVYQNDKEGTIIKVNKVSDGNISHFLRRLMVHNTLFPDTEYKLLGFAKDGNTIKPVVKQPLIVKNGVYDLHVVEKRLKDLGFSSLNYDAYLNQELGIILEDIDSYNVIFHNGVPFFIDPMIVMDSSYYDTPTSLTQGSSATKITPQSSPITLNQPATGITPKPTIHLTAQQHKEMNEAGSRGEIYYMLTPEQSEYIDRLKEHKGTTPIQRALIDGLYLKPVKMSEESAKVLQDMGIQPHERVMLNEATHTYTDVRGIVYHSTTEGINGKFTPEQQEEYKLNREWGIDCDNILQGIVLGKVDNGKLRPLNIEEIETTHLPADVKMDVYSTLRAFVHEYRQKGYIPLTQVVVASKGDNPEQNRAGSIDLLLISPDGTDNKVIDLKTSIRAAKEGDKLSSTYTSSWAPKEGSVFKNAVLDKDNNVVYRPIENGKVMKEEGDRDIKLSKELQHAIQVGSYGKMLELQGLPVGELDTLHLHLKIVDDKIESYKNEGLVPHPVENNRPYIDAIVPRAIDSDQWSELQKKVYGVEEGEPPIEDNGPTAAESIEKLDMTLDQFRKEFSKRKASPLPEMRQTSINEIKNLIADIGKLQEKGDIKSAMNMVLDYTSQITSDSLKFLSKEANMNHPQFFQYLTESLLIGGSNDTLLPTYLRKYLSDTARARFDNIKSDISELLETAGIKAKEYILRNVFGSDKVDGDTIAARFPKGGIEDISLTGSYLTNFDSLRNELIREAQYIAQREIKATDIETTQYQQEWVNMGNELATAVGDRIKDKKFWDIFYEHDSNGKKTGYINPTGDRYYDTADHIENALMDDKGEWKQFIHITDLKTASKEDIAYNVELAHAKEAQAKFRETERLDDNGRIVVGRYHHLSDTYIEERDKVMKALVHTTYQGDPLYVEYVPREGHVNAKGEESVQLKAFRNKYQTRVRYMSALRDMTTGEYTGAVEEKESYFPNSTYTIPNDHIDGDSKKESLLNPRWVKLNNPTDDIGRAQLKFYKEFIKRAVWSLNHLEGDAERYIAKLGIVPAQAHFFQTAAQAGMMNNIKFQMAHFFTALHKSDIEHTDPEGVSRRMLRMTQIANLRSQDKVDDLQKKITALGTQKSSMSKGEYKAQLKELNKQLQIESHKLSADDIDPDMVKQGMMLQVGANANFHKQSIEGKLLALEWALKQQKVIKTTGLGVPKRDREGNPVFKTEAERNDLRAMNQLMKNFYGISLDETQMGVLINRLQNLTSFAVMGFNIFNGANNLVLYRIKNAGVVVSRRFGFKKWAWSKATGNFLTVYLPGLAKKALEKSTHYGDKRPYSELEAFMKMYRLSAESNIEMEGGSHTNKAAKYAYMFEGFAIDAAKVVLTEACRISFDIMNRDTGTMVPWKDAYTYNPNTGELKLKPGFDPNDILHLLVKLEDIQTKTQGNYQAISQPAMVSMYLGKVAAQFHRFLSPSANDAVSRKFEHKTLGTQEGTWRSALGMVNVIREWDGNFYDPFNPFDKDSRDKFWESVPQHMKENLVYDGVQLVQLGILIALGAVIKGVAEDISAEDPTQKRWMNWLAYTASRLRFEQQTFIPVLGTLQLAELAQNPIPLQQTLRNLAEAVYLSAEYPFQSDDERNYKNGVFAGKSKVGHMWHKSIPLYREWDQFQNRLISQDYEGSLLGSNK